MAEENIVIKIKADVGITKEVIDAVTKAMENLGKTATIVTGNVKVTNKNLEDTNKILGQVAQTAVGADKAIAGAGNSVKKSNQQWMSLALVVQDLPYGFRGIQNNLPALLGGIAGVGGAAYLAFSVIISGLTFWDEHNRKVAASTKKVKEEQDQLFKGVSDEAVKVNELIQVLKNETETRDRKKRAIKELQTINIDVFKDLKLEGDKVDGLNTYYNKYIENLKNVILLKQYEKDLEAIIQAELKTGKPLQVAKQKELKNSTQLLNTNNTAVKDNIAVNKVSALKDIKVIDNINQYNNSQQKKLDLLEKIRKISPAVALGGGTDNVKKDKKVKEDADYYNKIIEQEQKTFTDNLDNELKYADDNSSKKVSILERYTAELNHWHELGFIQESFYLNKSADLHKQIYDTKKSIEEQSSKDQKVINDRNLQNSLDALKIQSDVESKILLKGGKSTSADRIAILEDYKSKLYELASVGGYTAEQFDKIDDALIRVDAAIAGSKDQVKSFSVTWTDTINGINQVVMNFVNDSLFALGDSIGKALSGESVDVINTFGTLLSDALKGVGTQLIAFATASLAAWALLETNNPITALAALGAGIAAVAAGSYMKANLEKDRSKGVKKFANGGVISGPTMGLMGEYPGAKSNPEVVAPLDKLKSMIGGGGGGQFLLRGQDLLLAVNRAQKASNLKGQTISLA